MTVGVLPSGDHHWTLLMISQHWFKEWLGAVRQQAITWTNVDPERCPNMVSLSHNDLPVIINTITYFLFLSSGRASYTSP